MWVTSLIEFYFKNRSVAKSMAVYKTMGFTNYECWRCEFDWLLNAVCVSDIDYLLYKYGPVCKLQLDDEDHKALWDSFIF